MAKPDDAIDLELTPVPATPALTRRAVPIALAAILGASGCTSDPGEPSRDAGPGVHDAGISLPVDAGPSVADAGIQDAGLPPPADAGD